MRRFVCRMTVAEGMRDLCEVRAVPVEIKGRVIWVRTQIEGNAAKIFHTAGVRIPPKLLKVCEGGGDKTRQNMSFQAERLDFITLHFVSILDSRSCNLLKLNTFKNPTENEVSNSGRKLPKALRLADQKCGSQAVFRGGRRPSSADKGKAGF